MLLKKSDQHFYIVDWDIPSEPTSKRRAFYRHLEKLKLNLGLFSKMSTKSVLVTIDRRLAQRVYNLASQYGVANIYIAKELDENL